MLGHIHVASPIGWIDLAAHVWIWIIASLPVVVWAFYEVVGWIRNKKGRLTKE